MDRPPRVGIVMPAYNAAHLLDTTLTAALAAADGAPVLVVDPGSTDNTREVAERLGAQVIRLPERAGPAEARNVGVEHLDVDVILFVDSDCVCHADTVQRVRDAFASDPSLVSLTGSYDDTPPERNFASLYMNLRHHFIHQRAKTSPASFWAGCGAVKRDTFRELGGFDVQQFPRPMIEDIELGLRLNRAGTTRLDPHLHVKHLKRWTVRSVVETDIKCRAIPWSKILLRTKSLPNDLNLGWTQRICAALSPFVLIGVVLAPIALAAGQFGLAGSLLVPTAISAFLQRGMIAFFQRTAGTRFAIGGWLFHQFHLFYSAVTLATMSLGDILTQGRLSASPNRA